MGNARIYLAGPDVFLPDADRAADAKRKLCARYGFIGVSPTDNELDLSGLSRQEAAAKIGLANEGMIRRCDLLIANLTPFRGPSADVGTAYELGFARALGLPVFAYTNEGGNLLERTRLALEGQVGLRPNGQPEDPDHMAIENFNEVDNLMLVVAAEAGGAPIVVNPTPRESRFTELSGFEACLRLAAQRLDVMGRQIEGRSAPASSTTARTQPRSPLSSKRR